ncbi:adenylate kinase [Dysgonomonas sp. 511]|uniref:adenylate kinase n=1 Tax=Dysgonomonas sp. 511 TaxID=2302930 RepID=UPI0013D2E8DE|nr:adenylate kinase [Dysgonomonas sp. 511]NDV78865.1 adenylate kinase [Dysgonomonas sp. 511]
MLNVIIFGAPGSGKGTQSENLIKKYNLAHISTGDVLRAEMKNGTELGKLAENYIAKGQLVPDDVVIGMLANVLDSKKDAAGVIFDGFPRTIPQSEALEKMLKERGQEVSIVVSLEVEEPELIDRLIKRGQQSGRSDDNLETIKSRLDVYKNQTSPLKEHYKTTGKLVPIKGIGTVEDIFLKISEAVDNIK